MREEWLQWPARRCILLQRGGSSQHSSLEIISNALPLLFACCSLFVMIVIPIRRCFMSQPSGLCGYFFFIRAMPIGRILRCRLDASRESLRKR